MQILSIDGEEVFSVEVGVYNGATDGANYSNMEVVDTSVNFVSGCMKIVFLNKFVNELLVSYHLNGHITMSTDSPSND